MRENYSVHKYSDEITIIENIGVRMFLIHGRDRDMLVDTGFGNFDLKKITEELTDKEIFVVNTHADRDHTGGNHYFDTIYMHPSDFDRYALSADSNGLLPLFHGDVIDLGSSCWEIIHVPGHTPGSIMLLDRRSRTLISGDTLQYGPIYMFGEGRNMDAYICSLEMLERRYNDTYDVILPSHGNIDIPCDIAKDLIAGANDILAGNVEKEPPERAALPSYLMRTGKVSFYYGNR